MIPKTELNNRNRITTPLYTFRPLISVSVAILGTAINSLFFKDSTLSFLEFACALPFQIKSTNSNKINSSRLLFAFLNFKKNKKYRNKPLNFNGS